MCHLQDQNVTNARDTELFSCRCVFPQLQPLPTCLHRLAIRLLQPLVAASQFARMDLVLTEPCPKKLQKLPAKPSSSLVISICRRFHHRPPLRLQKVQLAVARSLLLVHQASGNLYGGEDTLYPPV